MLTSKRGQSVKDSNAGLGHLFSDGLLPQYLFSTDSEGNVTSYTQITTNTDVNGNASTSTNHYDANWKVTESSYSDSSGNTSVTQYQTSADADGNVTSYTHITTNTDVNGNASTSKNHYDANWKVTESSYSDSSGNTSVTQYQTSTDADGIVMGYTHITTNTDVNGNASTSKNNYDANWKVTESSYSDNSGNNSDTQHQTNTDADGKVTSDGGSGSVADIIDGGNVARVDDGQKLISDLATVTAVDVSPSNDLTRLTNQDENLDFQIEIDPLTSIESNGTVNLSVDAVGNIFAGNVAVKTGSAEQIHTGIYGSEWTTLAAETIDDVNTVLWQHESGALHTWQVDANWQWVSSDGWWGLGSTEFDAAESNFGIDANNDGIIGALTSIDLHALTSIDLPVFEIVEEKIVPIICVCWFEEYPYPIEDLLNNWITKDIIMDDEVTGNTTVDFEIALVGVTAITASDFIL